MAIIVSSVGLYAFTNNVEGAYYSRDGIKRVDTRTTLSRAMPRYSSFNINVDQECSGFGLLRKLLRVNISYNLVDDAVYYDVYRDGIKISTIEAQYIRNPENPVFHDDHASYGANHRYHMTALNNYKRVIATSNTEWINTPDMCPDPFANL